MSWLEQSIMHTRGQARGRPGETHELPEHRQNGFIYTMGPYFEPRVRMKPGDRVVVETVDAFEGKLKTEQDKPSEKLELPFVNPQCGPIVVEGAEKGDMLAVYIESIAPRGPQPRGTCCLIPEFGGLTGTTLTATLNEPLPEIVRKVDIDERHVYWSRRITLPYEPFLGTLSCAPEIDAINSLTPDYHGGNMDLPDVRMGAICYLPVNFPGAHLFLGDCHAAQGDGELCGVAVEQASTTTLHVDLIKGWGGRWPRVETEDFIMTVGSARPMEDAARIAYRDLVRWLVADYGFDQWDAYMTLTQCGRARLGNMVDPKYTIGTAMPKKYLA